MESSPSCPDSFQDCPSAFPHMCLLPANFYDGYFNLEHILQIWRRTPAVFLADTQEMASESTALFLACPGLVSECAAEGTLSRASNTLGDAA